MDLFRAIKPVIDEWDPYDLMPVCPEDEYDIETKAIADALDGKDVSAFEIAAVVSRVFGESFAKEDFPIYGCISVANKIWDAIHSLPQ